MHAFLGAEAEREVDRETMSRNMQASMSTAQEAKQLAETAQSDISTLQGAVKLLDDKGERKTRQADLIFRSIPLNDTEFAGELVAVAVNIMSVLGLPANELNVEFARALRDST